MSVSQAPMLFLTVLFPSLILGQAAGEKTELVGVEHERASQPASSLKLEGGVDVYYGFNLNHPADRDSFIAGTGTTAKRADEVALNLASLGLSLSPKPVGFHFLIGYGTSMEVVHGGEPEGVSVGPEVWRFLQQASASWVMRDFELEAGVYPSHIGFEVLQSQLNWAYTRSWMAELSPYYQTGLKAADHFSPAWSAQIHLLNGWQLIADNNRALSTGTQVAYAESPDVQPLARRGGSFDG